mgnify:CR=1 FL=1
MKKAFSTMADILITGASGFIGRNLVAFLDNQGQASVSFSRERGVSLLDRSSLRNYFSNQNFTSVVHLASKVKGIKTAKDIESETQMAVNALSLLGSGSRFIYISTADIYDECETPLVESSAVVPINRYAVAKLQSEKALRIEASKRGVDLVILRPSLVYGADTPPGMFLSDLYESVTSSSLFVYSADNIIRDFIHVSDVCCAIHTLIISQNDVSGVYNLSTGIGTSLESIVCFVRTYIKKDIQTDRRKESENMVSPYLVLNSKKLQNSIPWKPVIPIGVGLREILLL